MKINELYRLEKKDIDKSAAMLAQSFSDYTMFQHVLGEDSKPENIKIFLKFLVKYTVLYGEAYATSSDLEGIILFTDFKDYNFGLIRSLRSGILSVQKIGAEAGKRFMNFDRFTLETHKKIIKAPHQYIILLGVDPAKQGQGYGSKLMRPVLEVADEKGQPCYLETHGEKNVALYQRYGFKVVSDECVPGTEIKQFSMIYSAN